MEDYYKILGVSKNATELEIKKAYRKQALKFHPDRNKDKSAKVKFQKIGQAFEVLVDKTKRQQGHHHNILTQQNQDLFAQFFKNDQPTSPIYSSDEDVFFNSFHHTTPPPSPPTKPHSVKRKLLISLDDLYTGTTKRLKVTRTTQQHQTSDKILTIHVIPGWKSGTKIRFPGEGDELPTGDQQDIEFEIQEKPHPVYTRKGDDLYTTMTLTLLEALTGFKKTLHKLDGTTLSVQEENEKHASIIHSGQEKIMMGEGMPNYKTGEKGDLIVTFLVEMPKYLSSKQRQDLKKVLVS